MAKRRYILEFMIHYLADESFRRAVLYRERTNLLGWGMDDEQMAELTGLDSAAILGRLQDEVGEMIAEGLFVDRVYDALREVGFDLDEAYSRIKEGGAPFDPQVAPLAMAAYGEGEVHVREIEPLDVQAGKRECITISGQGFSPRVAVGFAQGEALEPEVDGWIIDRHSDLDVHEYLVVEVELPRVGEWAVFVRRLDEETKQETWRRADCVLTARA